MRLALTIIMQEKNKGVVIQQNNVLQQEKFKAKIPKKKRQHLHQLQQNMNQKKKESEMSGTIESQNRFKVLDNRRNVTDEEIDRNSTNHTGNGND